MMPDLGKYAIPVLAAYGSSLVILAVLILGSVLQSRATRHALEAAEKRQEKRDA